MSGRDALGPADVDDEHLRTIVARLLGEPVAELRAVEVETVPYDLEAITTGGRWWVCGEAVTAGGRRPFRMFVKLVQSWSRSPQFASVPEEVRDFAAASVPWRTELEVYRSDLGDLLPDGLSMPRAAAVVDIDDLSGAIWMEAVPERPQDWDDDRFARAALLLGRLSGSPKVAPLAQIDDHAWTVHDYLHGRLAHQVVPMVLDDGIWRHPLVAGAFPAELRDRMTAALDELPAWVDELAAAPHVPGHGDACPNNLLAGEHDDDFVLIDFGFWKPLPLGFDLGQLLLGDVQLGRRSADGLRALDERIVAAYADGLRAEGTVIDVECVDRWHALQMAVFTGVSALPFEHLEGEPTAELAAIAAGRAAITTYCLDRVEATRPTV